jgi:hypothetical protein
VYEASFPFAAPSRLLFCVILVSEATACSGGAQPGTTAFPADAYLTVMSESAELLVQMRTSPQPPQRGTIGVELVVTSAADGAARDGLIVHVVPWMPAHGHGTSLVPTVMAKSHGRYVLTDVDLFMPGHWELRTTFSGPLTDHVAPAFDVP